MCCTGTANPEVSGALFLPSTQLFVRKQTSFNKQCDKRTEPPVIFGWVPLSCI